MVYVSELRCVCQCCYVEHLHCHELIALAPVILVGNGYGPGQEEELHLFVRIYPFLDACETFM